jgi:RNA polymerase sigma-70 factor (ECF subfamily)
MGPQRRARRAKGSLSPVNLTNVALPSSRRTEGRGLPLRLRTNMSQDYLYGMSDPEQLVSELYCRSRAQDYQISRDEFARILAEVAAKCLGKEAALPEVLRLYESLHIEELALTRGCAAGDERAWEVFLTRYRAKLYEMAGTIAREDAAARELTDSLYAELYGLDTRGGERASKLVYYVGRGSLEGWLRTVMAQTCVDRYRSQKLLVSLEEQQDEGLQFAAIVPEPVNRPDARLPAAIRGALGEVSAQDRFVLAAYFLDGHTLAEIGRTLNAHESTISRKVEKLVRRLRARIVKRLAASGMDRRAAEEALEVDVRDLSLNLRADLAQGAADGPFNK